MANQASEDLDIFLIWVEANRDLSARKWEEIVPVLKDKIQNVIRTEKLKLLDEVRERQIPVIALKAKKPHDEVQIQAVPIESLSELEAEL